MANEKEVNEKMSREQAYLRMLDASAKLQWNVAMILEAKAVEAEKVKGWLINHVTSDSFTAHQEQLKECLIVHSQLIDVIDGLTKLGQGMTSVLKVVLPQESEGEEDESSGLGGLGGLGGMFGGLDFGSGDDN